MNVVNTIVQILRPIQVHRPSMTEGRLTLGGADLNVPTHFTEVPGNLLRKRATDRDSSLSGGDDSIT